MRYIELELSISPLIPFRDIAIYELGELGFESFVNEKKGLKAYIQEKEFDENKALSWVKNYPELIVESKASAIEQENWNAKWESQFEPIYIADKLQIRAEFHTAKPNIEFDLVITPQMSFGTGHHETTYLISEMLLEKDLKDKRVLDMGCGTSVLAILAEFKGASDILAIDNDEWAVNNSKENIERNKCRNIRVVEGGKEKIPSEPFDMILANINKNILLDQVECYASALKQGGEIYISGFFVHDLEDIKHSFSNFGLNFVFFKDKNEWCMARFDKV
jgi:ribosomal protein L11 methyltransferase